MSSGYPPTAAALLATLALSASAAAGAPERACLRHGCGAHPVAAYAATAYAAKKSQNKKHPVRKVLAGDGVGRAVFGESRASVVHRIDMLLGRRPSDAYHPAKRGGGVDHEIQWPLLRAFFGDGRFVGYEYGGRIHGSDQPVLATRKGLRTGDTVAAGERLYGPAFELSAAQGGSWSVKTPQGQLIGYTSQVTNPKGKIMTIDAGHVGGPALTP